MTTLTRATYDAYGSVELVFLYHPSLISALKAEILRHSRRYDPDTRSWSVAPEDVALAVRLLRRYFPGAEIRDDDGFDLGPAPIRAADRAYAVLHLLPSAPPELIQAAYRTPAKTCHPDRGGDGETMRRLNEALDRIGVAS